MRKSLIVLSLSLVTCVSAAAVFTAAAQAPAHNPVLLAQATSQPPARTRGRNLDRPGPNAAERNARRDEICQEAYARSAGRFAYLEARLNLTAAQTPAFARWRDLRLAAAKRRAGECANRPMTQDGSRGRERRALPNPVERLARQESRLQHRLADIQAERPALEAFYNSLNPAQRQTLSRERGFGARERGFGPGGMGPRMGPPRMGPPRIGMGDGNRMYGRGPGMMPPPGDQPPPPPSQFPQ